MNSETVNFAVGRTLRDLRKTAEIKQGQLAEAVGLPQTTICKIEHGYQAATIDRFIRIAHACGATPVFVLGQVQKELNQKALNDA
jgi:transcriptional regulator with XRE-family HTH domain